MKWSEKEKTAFNNLKAKLSDAPVLTHFSDELPKLDTGVIIYGVHAVISHIYANGKERQMPSPQE